MYNHPRNKKLSTPSKEQIQFWGEGIWDLYPFTFICYRFAKRIYLEARTDEEIEQIIEDCNNGAHSISHVLSPTGVMLKRDEFFEEKGD